MKDKILAAIKLKFPKVNLSKARLNAIAAKIEEKIIDDETKIDAAIDEFNDFNPLAEIAKSDDKIRTLEAKVKTPAPAKKDDEEPAEEQEEPLLADTPGYVKEMMKGMALLTKTVSQLQADKAQTTVRSKAAEALKDIPEKFWNKRSIPEKEEDLEAFVEEVKTDYSDFAQEQTNNGLSALPRPVGAGAAAKKEAISPEIKAFAEKQAAAAAPAKTGA